MIREQDIVVCIHYSNIRTPTSQYFVVIRISNYNKKTPAVIVFCKKKKIDLNWHYRLKVLLSIVSILFESGEYVEYYYNYCIVN